MTRLSFREIRNMLQLRAGSLARELAPGGSERGGAYVAPNPTRNDDKAGSFRIYTSGPKAGGFVDYAGVNANFEQGGDRGDVIDLIAYTRTNRDRIAAVKWAEDWLGLVKMDARKRQSYADDARAKAQLQEKAEHAGIAKREARAKALFDAAMPLRAKAMAKPVDYLKARGIDLGDIPHLSGDIRFSPALEWWEGAERINGRYAAGPEFPAIVCGLRDASGVVRAVHCTFLDPERNRKAPVAKPKLMFGSVAGCVIRIQDGPDGLPLEESELRIDVGIGEGLEDGLSIALGLPEDRVWAATSLGNLGNVYLQHPLVRCAIVARDNDWAKKQAVAQFNSALERLESHGKPVAVVSACAGKDFNDLLNGDS